MIPFPAARAWSQTIGFPGDQGNTLLSLTALVLPADSDTTRVAKDFERYVREYRTGADTDHGYGNTHVRPKPASPAPEYMRQLAAFPAPLTRAAVEKSLEDAHIKELPRLPDGKNLIADLMSFYFRSADANDLCYRAAIQRDTCRGFEVSSKEPAPLKERV